MSVKNSRTFLETILEFLNLKTIKSDTDNIAGEVTANAGTNLNTSLLTLESGGNLSSIKTKLDSALTNMEVRGEQSINNRYGRLCD